MMNWVFFPEVLWSGTENQVLIYTGVKNVDGEGYQAQCLAVGDGLNYEKSTGKSGDPPPRFFRQVMTGRISVIPRSGRTEIFIM